MSIENAKLLVEKLGQDKELRLAFAKDSRAAVAAGDYGCTYEEVKEAYVMNRELDEKELETVTGGFYCPGEGGCDKEFLVKDCVATVEKFSWCSSNDWCAFFDEQYTEYTHSECGRTSESAPYYVSFL